MKAGITIDTERLHLRHWRNDDLDVLHRLNSDERIMHFFPFRRNRKQSAELLEKIRKTLATDGFAWAAVTRADSGDTIGFSGLCNVRFEASFTPAVEIGWRFLPEHWGRGYATEAAEALLDHGFADLGLREIVSFAVPGNRASVAVMERIGMTARPDLDFDMPGISDEHAHLRRHVFYSIKREDWQGRE